jgi:hypothetical protein
MAKRKRRRKKNPVIEHDRVRALAQRSEPIKRYKTLDEVLIGVFDRALAVAERDPDEFLTKCRDTVLGIGEVVEEAMNRGEVIIGDNKRMRNAAIRATARTLRRRMRREEEQRQ